MVNDDLLRYWYGLDRSLPAIGFGCWQLAGNHEVDGRPNGWGDIDREQVSDLVGRALDAGIRFFDTAQGYGFGQGERNLGFALGRHDLGGEAVVCTKIPCDAISERGVEALVHESMSNLERDYVDILLLHNPPDDLDYKAELLGAFTALKRSGKIRDFGISGRTLAGVVNAIEAGFGQVMEWNFNLLERRPIEQLFPLCRDRQVNFVARSPLCRGLLSDRFYEAADTRFPETEFRSTLDPQWLAWVKSELGALDRSGVLHRPVSQLAMQYLLEYEEVSAIIPGINKRPHLDSAIALFSSPALQPGLVAKLNQLLPDCYPGYR